MRTFVAIIISLTASVLSKPHIQVSKRQDMCQASSGDSCSPIYNAACCDSTSYVVCDPQGEIYFDECDEGEVCVRDGECVTPP
jgi:hypothetical protein